MRKATDDEDQEERAGKGKKKGKAAVAEEFGPEGLGDIAQRGVKTDLSVSIELNSEVHLERGGHDREADEEAEEAVVPCQSTVAD